MSPDSPSHETEPAGRPVSLRIRLLVLAVLVLAVSLGLVGFALDSAYSRSSEADLGDQMETWVYLVLGATEVSDSGEIVVQDDIGDPRLSQPNSGIYVHVHGNLAHWSSPSSLGVDLPELSPVAPGENLFLTTADDEGFYTYQYGVAWELADQSVQPFTVSVLVEAIAGRGRDHSRGRTIAVLCARPAALAARSPRRGANRVRRTAKHGWPISTRT
jgi:hypothetical protein